MANGERASEPNSSPTHRRFRWLWIVGGVLLVPALIYYCTPTAWIVPDAPFIEGSRGLGVISFPEVQPRWTWIKNRGTRALPALRQTVTSGTTPYTRRRAAEILGQMKDTGAIPALGVVIQNDDTKHLRIEAARALGEIGSAQAIPILLQTIRQNMRRYANDGSFERDVKQAALLALGQIGSEAVPALLECAQKHLHDRQQVIIALGQIGDDRAVPFLLKTLNEGSRSEKHQAAIALVMIGKINLNPAPADSRQIDLQVHEPAIRKWAESYKPTK